MPLSTAKLHQSLLLRVGAALTLLCSCLPEDDLASYSRAWTSEPETLLPGPAGDGGALPTGADAGEPTQPPGAIPSAPRPPVNDAGAPRSDAGEPLDAGPDGAVEAADADAPTLPEPPRADGGVSSDAGL